MPQLLHPRSVGTIQTGIYTKSANLNLEEEAVELERCGRLSLQTPHVRPIKLIQYDSANNLLLTKYIEGESLFNLLWNRTSIMRSFFANAIPDDTLLLRIKEIGTWLALYHDSWKVGGDRIEATQWLADSFRRKMKCLSERRIVNDELLRKLEEILESLPEKLGNAAGLKIGKIHGDFIAYNLLYDHSGNVYILDFGDARVGFNLEDVVRFWEHLWVMGQTSRWRMEFFTNACEAFVSGYGIGEAVVKQEEFVVLRAYNALTNFLAFHVSSEFLNWRSRRITSQMTNSSFAWVQRQFSLV